VQKRASQSTYQRIYAVIRRIPRGRVATYGQVARLAGIPGRARQVGYALHALPSASAVPWQRVVNASGGISLHPMSGGLSQRLILEKEGIRFDARDRVSLARFGWRPKSAGRYRAAPLRRAAARQ
jgi:methylated-DNA-protein-cysteine methyltransferase-like protein